MSQCLPGSSTPAKVLFFQTSARSCWATVIRLIVMSLSFFLHSPNAAAGPSSGGNSLNKSEATPHLPHGDRVLRVRRRRECSRHRSCLPGANSSSTVFAPDRAQVEHRRTGVVRAAMCKSTIAGALRLRDFRPAVVMQTGINRGSRTPSREALPSNDLSGRCNRGSRTLGLAVVSCLLSH